MKPQKPIRLFWGENYAPIPPIVKTAIEKSTIETIENINLYPGDLNQEIIDLIAKTYDVRNDEVILGHGIEGLIHLCTQTFLDTTKKGGAFKPSFYVMLDNIEQFPYITYLCDYKNGIDIDDFISKIQCTDLFFAASPNTSTGKLMFTEEQIEKILQSYKGVLVIDECYFGHTEVTALPLIKKYQNLLILRGVTKIMGLGSLRLGFAIGDKTLINKLKSQSSAFESDPISSFSLNAFKETLPYFDILKENTKKFFSDFMDFMQKEFHKDKFMRTLSNYQYMDIREYNVATFKVCNYMTENNYVMSDKELTDNSTIPYPEFFRLTPPPSEYWKDFAETLKQALNN